MHIAVLAYGRLNKCVEHYDNIVESLGKDNKIDFFLSSDNSSESLLTEFVNLYKPLLYINTPIKYDYNLDAYPGRRGETNIHNMTCHFINKNRVLSLLEEHVNKCNIQYDCVVSLRLDCVFRTNFVFDNLKDNTIYIPAGFDYVENAINDQVAYGKIDVMKKYNSINPVDLLKKRLTIPHPESLTLAYIVSNKLEIQRPSINYRLEK